MTHEEAEERLRSGWHVESPLLELIEGDYDSAQRKRFIRYQQQLRPALFQQLPTGLEQQAQGPLFGPTAIPPP